MITEFKENRIYNYTPLHRDNPSMFMTYIKKYGNREIIVCKDVKSNDNGFLLEGWEPGVVFPKGEYEYITDVTDQYPEYLV